MKTDIKSDDFIEKFDVFTRATSSDSVIIHPALKYGFIELTEDFVQQLKNDLSNKIMMAHTGIEDLDPTTRFAIMMLEDAY